MITHFLSELFKARMSLLKGEAPSVTISLDLNDPKSRKLAEIAKKMLIPTTRVYNSGITTKTGVDSKEMALEFIEILHKELGQDLINELLKDLENQTKLKQLGQVSEGNQELFSNPNMFGQMIESYLQDEQSREPFDHSQRVKCGNLAKDLMNRKVEE